MSAKTEGMHTGEFLLSEGPGTLSRENVLVTVDADTILPAGAVLAASGDYYVPVTSGLVGSSAALGILYGEADNQGGSAAANIAGVIINTVAEVRGADLDWNAMGGVDIQAAMDLLYAQGVKVRDYTAPEGS